MARRLTWSERARADLREIVEYIAADAPGNAGAVAHRMLHRVRSLSDQPGQGRHVPEHEGTDELREVIVQSWRIIYRVTEAEVVIVAVVHSARLLRNVSPL